MPMNLLFNYELLELGVGGGGQNKVLPRLHPFNAPMQYV